MLDGSQNTCRCRRDCTALRRSCGAVLSDAPVTACHRLSQEQNQSRQADLQRARYVFTLSCSMWFMFQFHRCIDAQMLKQMKSVMLTAVCPDHPEAWLRGQLQGTVQLALLQALSGQGTPPSGTLRDTVPHHAAGFQDPECGGVMRRQVSNSAGGPRVFPWPLLQRMCCRCSCCRRMTDLLWLQ